MITLSIIVTVLLAIGGIFHIANKASKASQLKKQIKARIANEKDNKKYFKKNNVLAEECSRSRAVVHDRVCRAIREQKLYKTPKDMS